MLMSNQSHNV
jgi:hypothetical protein